MALVVEIGNTRVKVATFHEKKLIRTAILESPGELEEWIEKPIVFLDTRRSPLWREALRSYGAEELTTTLGVPFPTRYSTELGPDRAAALTAVWAEKRFPATLISLGTACVVDYLDATGYHQGGVITAGLSLRLWALAHRTGRLPLVEPAPTPPPLGTTTQEALQSGCLRGLAHELAGWIQQLGPASLWITGGEAPLLLPYLPSHAIFAPTLILTGAWLWWLYLQERGFSGSS
uniref:Type III pantothenate kinase n=1 Tax=uncultured Bacteroidota bacterium TaxID=152509 RepID=H5SK32_9BACT|nr:hypothetical conserved protein [uncultured Bacteroidetes bacterium]